MNSVRFRLVLWCAILFAAFPALSGPPKSYGKIEILRDTWGIPHVFSETDTGAMYGLGYATAEERGFQMTYSLRIMQGRLAELVGERTRPGRSESGLARFLKDATSRIAADPKAVLDEDEQRFIDNILAAAWKGTGGPREPNPRQPTRPAAQRP